MAQLVKNFNGLAIASVKNINALAIASVKTVNGLDNTSGGGTNPSVTQSAKGHYPASASDLKADTSALTTVAGRSLLVCVISQEAADPVISDSKGNTYTQLGTRLDDTFATYPVSISWWVCRNPTMGASHVITATGQYPTIFALEIQDLAAASYTEAQSKVADSSSPFGNSSTTTGSNRLVVSFFSYDTGGATDTSTPTVGFTKHQQEGDASAYWAGAVASKQVAAAGATPCDWTVSGGSPTKAMVASVAFIGP